MAEMRIFGRMEVGYETVEFCRYPGGSAFCGYIDTHGGFLLYGAVGGHYRAAPGNHRIGVFSTHHPTDYPADHRFDNGVDY